MHYKTVGSLLNRHHADEKIVRFRIRNPRATITLDSTVKGEPRYRKDRGCFCIPIQVSPKRRYWLRCPDIERIDKV